MVHKGLVLIAAAVALVVHFLVFSSGPGQNLDDTAFFFEIFGIGEVVLIPFWHGLWRDRVLPHCVFSGFYSSWGENHIPRVLSCGHVKLCQKESLSAVTS